MSIAKDLIFTFTDGVKAREEDFGLLVVSKSTPALSLNKDCKFVWELIDGKRTVSDILDKLNEEYEGDNIEELLYQILESLQKLNLIKAVNN